MTTTLETIQAAEQRVAALQTRLHYVDRGLRGAEAVAKTAQAAKKNTRTVVVCTAAAVVGIAVVALMMRRRRKRKRQED